MLNKKTFFEQMNNLVVSYPMWKFEKDNPLAIKVWYGKFKHFEDERFIQMIDKYMENDKFSPTIAGLKEWDIMPRKDPVQIRHEKEMESMRLEKEKEEGHL